MNEKELYILLTIVKKNGDVKRLTREGLDYKTIAEMTNTAIIDGLIIYVNDTICLSEKGESFYSKLDKRLKQTDKNKWIEPKNDSRIPILDKKFIFLPKQDELHF